MGRLSFVRDGHREYSSFGYSTQWLRSPERFEVSPDLPLQAEFSTRRALSALDSPFPGAIADTAPDAWGRRVISRAHAKRRANDPDLRSLTAMDYLAAVDDFSRIGALRLADENGRFLGSGDPFRTPQLVDLGRVSAAARRVEEGSEDDADLDYLQGKATSLGGLRPKCTVIDEDGSLAIGKFPSLSDERSIVRSEVLALRLVAHAGCQAAAARVIRVENTDIAVVRRFDRTADGARIPYLSGGSLLQARREEDRAYTELADAIRRVSAVPSADLRELWRRLLINLLVTNVDDHLWNVGFLYAGEGRWRLAPAFDVNPFPDKEKESKTWLSEASGPITSLEQLCSEAEYFDMQRSEAERVAGTVATKLAQWRTLAAAPDIGLSARDVADLEPAFEHESARQARALASAEARQP